MFPPTHKHVDRSEIKDYYRMTWLCVEEWDLFLSDLLCGKIVLVEGLGIRNYLGYTFETFVKYLKKKHSLSKIVSL